MGFGVMLRRSGGVGRVRWAAVAAGCVLLVGVAVVLRPKGGAAAWAGELTRSRDLICAETGEAFPGFRLPEGAAFPIEHPRTGRATLWTAERCWWGPDGTARAEPTLVLLNEHRGLSGPTRCPDCGRGVVYRNPMPPAEAMAEALAAR